MLVLIESHLNRGHCGILCPWECIGTTAFLSPLHGQMLPETCWGWESAGLIHYFSLSSSKLLGSEIWGRGEEWRAGTLLRGKRNQNLHLKLCLRKFWGLCCLKVIVVLRPNISRIYFKIIEHSSAYEYGHWEWMPALYTYCGAEVGNQQ